MDQLATNKLVVQCKFGDVAWICLVWSSFHLKCLFISVVSHKLAFPNLLDQHLIKILLLFTQLFDFIWDIQALSFEFFQMFFLHSNSCFLLAGFGFQQQKFFDEYFYHLAFIWVHLPSFYLWFLSIFRFLVESIDSSFLSFSSISLVTTLRQEPTLYKNLVFRLCWSLLSWLFEEACLHSNSTKRKIWCLTFYHEVRQATIMLYWTILDWQKEVVDF